MSQVPPVNYLINRAYLYSCYVSCLLVDQLSCTINEHLTNKTKRKKTPNIGGFFSQFWIKTHIEEDRRQNVLSVLHTRQQSRCLESSVQSYFDAKVHPVTLSHVLGLVMLLEMSQSRGQTISQRSRHF